MPGKTFTFDLGRIMDEAFKAARNFSETFEQGMAEGFHKPCGFGGGFNWRNYQDCYPFYSYPPANIYLTKERNLIFEIALAGFEEKDIDLKFRGDYLYFSARISQKPEVEAGAQYFKKKLKLKDIEEQRYYVPQDKFDQENIQAHFKNGLLKIVVPSREDAAEKEGFKVNISGEDE